MKRVHIIGMGLSPDDLTPRHLELIRRADLLVGGRRHLACFSRYAKETLTIQGDLNGVCDRIRRRMAGQRVVVLASGDPLCFGVGARLIAALGAGAVHVHPNISAMAAAFARIKEPWDRARLVSLHGRAPDALWQALQGDGPVAVLTDPVNSPDRLAALMAAKGLGHLRLAVFERLGADNERIGWYAPAEAAARRFADPNLVVVKTPESQGTRVCLGLTDEDFTHEQGLITKAEVRAVSLAKLRLGPGLTLWDLGAGCGSVGIEAARMSGAGRVVAVERDADRAAVIEANARRHGVLTLTVIREDLPRGMETLPRPDRIFIGGGGRRLGDIAAAAVNYLPAGGVIAVNTVLTANLDPIMNLLEQKGLTVEAVQVQVSRCRPMPWSRRFDALNPVWIISGRKPF